MYRTKNSNLLFFPSCLEGIFPFFVFFYTNAFFMLEEFHFLV
ncbi:hypothetical protein HMPREF0083_03580 [Aneurinibacillus aneurinilyticus ATCC 12856]|uniref:Uncharacterized protein n=1 Tax=Aneurinibacillus aneurinilyticus ATCC 12856 TaxID=649747 RepID=U1X1B5_ANEAE|nr:hypothetical protein HMPREF0083_03580 [Aneurinibacillus aneurinilyticus ATCC 12856]